MQDQGFFTRSASLGVKISAASSVLKVTLARVILAKSYKRIGKTCFM